MLIRQAFNQFAFIDTYIVQFNFPQKFKMYIFIVYIILQSQLFIQFIIVLSFSRLNYFRAFAFLRLTRVDIAPVPILSPFAYLDVRKGDVTRPR